MTLGERIRQARVERLSMTQREVAALLGIESVNVSRWERDVSEPKPRHLRELARVTGVPVSWFFEDEPVAA